MLIKELILKNFLTFYGEQSLEFPTGDAHSVSLVLGPNNSGKSSFVKALHFLLHERLPGCKAETAWMLINNRHRDETAVKDEAGASVTATFVFQNKELTIRRRVRARRVGEGIESFTNAQITFAYLRASATSHKFVEDTEGSTRRRLEVSCPEALLEAFFFSGEPLDGKLLRGVQQVKESLEEYLSLRQWEGAAEAARELRKRYASQKQRFAAANRDLDVLIRDETELQNRLDEKRREKAQAESKVSGLKEALEEKQSAILSIGTQTQMRADVEDREKLQSQLVRHEHALRTADSEIAETVGRSSGYPFLLRFTTKARSILERLHAENVLPADISSGFVDRVIAMPKCICGTAHTAATRDSWRSYLEKTLRADVGTKLVTLAARAQDEAPNSIRKNATESAKQLQSAIAQHEEAIRASRNLQASIATLSARIQESPVEELRRLETERRKLESEGRTAEDRLRLAGKEVEGIVSSLKRKKEERAKLKISPDVERKVKELERMQSMADALGDLIEASVAALRRQFHISLQDSMSEMYDEQVTDQTAATVNVNTLLPAILQDGRRVTNLGGGQSQLLGLAYITSIARLRRALHEGVRQLKINLGVVGDQAFVLDCPFSGMEGHYIDAAVKGIRAAARQTIFLLHGSQWKVARDYVENAVDSLSGVHLYAPAEVIARVKHDDRVYSFRNKQYELASELKKGEISAYSLLEPLEVGRKK